jgi:heme-degrading monooxygenase HmoA
MFIAMNRFRVKKGSEDAFEKVWLGRESYLDRVPGFLEFHLLRGPEAEDHTLYSSHTVWQSKRAFEAWTKSEQFRAARARAGNETTGPLYLEHPASRSRKHIEGSRRRIGSRHCVGAPQSPGGGRIQEHQPLHTVLIETTLNRR